MLRRQVREIGRIQSMRRLSCKSPAGRDQAFSLAEASKDPSRVRELRLEDSSPDLQCRNVFCEFAGGSCVCKLSKWIEQTHGRLSALRVMSLRDARLGKLPPSIWMLEQLEELDLRGNDLKEIPPGILGMRKLRVLKLDDNAFEAPPDGISELQNLSEFTI